MGKKHKRASMAGITIPKARKTDVATSHEAAREAEVSSPAQLIVALAAFEDHPAGMTDREAAEYVMGFVRPRGATAESFRRRCSDLRHGGYLRRTDERRHKAFVSVITGEGRAMLETEFANRGVER